MKAFLTLDTLYITSLGRLTSEMYCKSYGVTELPLAGFSSQASNFLLMNPANLYEESGCMAHQRFVMRKD